MAIKQLSRDNFGIRQARFVLRGTDFPLATGGTETVINPEPNVFYRVHSFTDVGTSSLQVLRGGEFEYLVVAGGAGGAGGSPANSSGGGGAGGLLAGKELFDAGVKNILVGDFGDSGDGFSVGSNGGNSSLKNIIALGGGGGGVADVPGSPGGSGGGMATRASFDGSDENNTGVEGQGNRGGFRLETGNARDNDFGGGGGGGATSAGADITGPTNGIGNSGGAGLISKIDGIQKEYARGGDGGTKTLQGANGAPNSGSGGQGGGGVTSATGGNGGSGIVIVRYHISAGDFIASGGVIA